MAWVRSEYAAELAVLSAWVSMLVPLNVAWHGSGPLNSTVVFLRFALFELQYRMPSELVIRGAGVGNVTTVPRARVEEVLRLSYPGVELLADFFVTTPVTAARFYAGFKPRLYAASLAWTVAALFFLAALAFSVALYLREEEVTDRVPGSEVRLMGGLLGAGTLGATVATAYYYLGRAHAGFPIPLGLVVVGVLAAVLLRTEET